jgi:hypothetical protein
MRSAIHRKGEYEHDGVVSRRKEDARSGRTKRQKESATYPLLPYTPPLEVDSLSLLLEAKSLILLGSQTLKGILYGPAGVLPYARRGCGGGEGGGEVGGGGGSLQSLNRPFKRLVTGTTRKRERESRGI